MGLNTSVYSCVSNRNNSCISSRINLVLKTLGISFMFLKVKQKAKLLCSSLSYYDHFYTNHQLSLYLEGYHVSVTVLSIFYE
jgi:hypothetical protein